MQCSIFDLETAVFLFHMRITSHRFHLRIFRLFASRVF
jgi:hypothetical protein